MVNNYKQTTQYTTAASSLLSILNYFNPEIQLNKENELKIWHNTVVLPTRASSIYALATYAKQQGLNPKIIVDSTEFDFPDYRFYRYTKQDIEQAKVSAQLHLEKTQQENIEIEQKNCKVVDVKNLLKDNILLIRLNAKPIREEKRNTSNYLVLFDFKNNMFHALDPLTGKIEIAEETMQEAFESLETKKYRLHKMIVFPKMRSKK